MPTEPLDIVHADSAVVVVNKPAGLLTVPGKGPDKQDCLSNRMLARYPNTRIVHRLDQATSGLVIFPQGYTALRHIGQQFEQRRVDKTYIAVVAGLLEQDNGSVDLPLICDWPNRPRQMVDHEHGKSALTRYRVLARDSIHHCTRVSLEPVTGRSHQLRVHMSALGHPILGDQLYATPEQQAQAPRLLLHAAHIQFEHPETGQPVSLYSEVDF